MNHTETTWITWLTCSIALALAGYGCVIPAGGMRSTGGDEDPPGMDDPPPDPSAPARIRVLHLSPDAPAVDVFANGTGPVVSGLTFPSGTGYLDVPAGAYDFEVAPMGAPATDAVLRVTDADLAGGRHYTAVAFDRLSAPINALLIEDSDRGLVSGSIRVRAIHTASGVGDVDLWLMADGEMHPLADDLYFARAGESFDAPARAYTVGVDTNEDATPEITFELPALPGGTVVNVYAVTDGSGALFLLAQLPDGSTTRIDPRGEARVRVLHLSPDAPAVDVFVDGGADAAISGLEFLGGTGYVTLSSGTHDFAVSASGTPESAAVLRADDVGLDRDRDYTVVAYGELASIAPLAIADDATGIGAADFRVRAIHTAAGVPPVDVYNVDEHGIPSLIIDDLAFGEASSNLDLPAGIAYRIGLDVDADARPDAVFTLPTAPAGVLINAFAVRERAGNVLLLLQLPDGTPLPVRHD